MEETKMEQRLKFVIRVREEDTAIAKACREFNISRPTGYKWLRRYDEKGLDGLKDQSRVPETIPHKTDERLEQMICSLRKQHPQLGPKKLRAWLRREHPQTEWPAASTIGDILKRNELVEDRSRSQKTQPYTEPLQQADAPNRIWSADFKGQFQLKDGTGCYPLTVTDNYSRALLGCKALPSTKGAAVKSYFEQVFSKWGLPEAIRTDNGAPFASGAPRGLSTLSAWWRRLGITHERIEPGKPQQNARHERFHLTLKNKTARPGEATMAKQQQAFEDFTHYFNHLRPHESLDQTVPIKHHEKSSRSLPQTLPEQTYPACDLSRKVAKNGQIRLAGSRIYVSKSLTHYRVGLTEVDVGVWVVQYADEDIGLFETGETMMSGLAPKHLKVKRIRI
jgi:transposase InsO family protein